MPTITHTRTTVRDGEDSLFEQIDNDGTMRCTVCGSAGEVGAARVTQADTRLLTVANAQGWTGEELFAWLNSKPGRWYGEAWFSQYDGDEAAERAACDYLHRITDY